MNGKRIPEEPVEIKRFLRSIIEASGTRGKFVVFTGNRLPKYLWDAWEPALKSRGYKWQDLLRAVSRASNIILEWVEGDAPWERVVEAVWGELERARAGAAPARGPGRARRLDEFF